ncbi:MAG: adenine deaminase [Lachnospiraceae bacterium]|nr:adenine deaminase [Lachnospiraceae bacterium]
MKTLLKNGSVVNVFTGEVSRENVLICDDIIVGVGDYADSDADMVTDVSGCTICPGLIDGHIHIESTMLAPAELARAVLPHGTTAVVTDPHEIANVCGTKGIDFMLAMSEGLPLTVYVNVPSCVPAMPLDESGAEILAADMVKYFTHPRVTGLAEMMNYPGVIAGEDFVMDKIKAAKAAGKNIDGHAPLLSGHDLDKYIAAGISTDHECSSAAEAEERIRKGQWLMIREGTAARNLEALLPMFEEPYCRRSLLVTDDRHPADILMDGHIDNIIRSAVQKGKSAVTSIQMATINAAQCFGLKGIGAVAPGYRADLLVLSDLDTVAVRDVYCGGKPVVIDGVCQEFDAPSYDNAQWDSILDSFNLSPLSASDFHVEQEGDTCRVIGVIPGELITDELEMKLDFSENNGIDVANDVLKLAVIERHKNTGHRGVGFIKGIGLKSGAIAASVSHDSHNLIVIGTNDEDMAVAANRVRELKGGSVAVKNGQVLAELPLPIAGLMSDKDAQTVAWLNKNLDDTVRDLGVPENISPFMNMAFVSLTVIPHIKMTTHGLADVHTQRILPLFTDREDHTL